MCAGSRVEASGSAGPISHVMLSYQWSSKIMVLKLRDKLRVAGYKVWMDIDNLGECHMENSYA